MADEVSFKDFGASFKGFLDQVAREAPAEAPFFRRLAEEHFGANPSQLTTVSEGFSGSEHPNVQRALDAWLAVDGRTHRLLGVAGADHLAYMGLSAASLLAEQSAGFMGGAAPTEGPVRYDTLQLEGEQSLSCIQQGLVLASRGDERVLLLVSGPRDHFNTQVTVEVVARDRGAAEAVVTELRRLVHEHNVYRGKVVSLESRNHGQDIRLVFHALPAVERDAIILPQGVLERIERQALAYTQHAAALRASRRHLKRGLLLHGPPGTGKTYTAMYLASRMQGRTVFIVTGRGQSLLEEACRLARMLQPATVILEDVDLIAEDRKTRADSCQPLLFELLNQMDGLADDADVLFVLTTNRPDILEPALAARPGRIDQAIEVPLPDDACRRRLLALYAEGLVLNADLDPWVKRTGGASAAFIRELLRRAALFAADDGAPITVKDKHLDDALHELVLSGGKLTRALLGFDRSRVGDDE